MSKISTLKPGDSVESFYLVKRAQDGVTQQGKPYMTLILADKTGELDSKLWTVTPEQITELKEADLVKVRGEIINYRGKNQMKILEIKLYSSTKNGSNFLKKPHIKPNIVPTITIIVVEIIANARDFLAPAHVM